ncbi:unnamed protein product [Polarella glacialis]|uniref:Uncharacterized protein n=1 Tax=Polarella glacialis TaxID=89957 RepID=A0A813H5G5_POLGL|nr:unnamed protein product [Polarella glacialis]
MAALWSAHGSCEISRSARCHLRCRSSSCARGVLLSFALAATSAGWSSGNSSWCFWRGENVLREVASSPLSRRQLGEAIAAGAVAQSVPALAVEDEVAQRIQAATDAAAAAVSLGAVSEDLVLPDWFVGNWACAGELFKVETGPGGQKALAAALPNAPGALLASNQAVGMDEGDFRAKRRWKATEKKAPGSEKSGALEEKEGIPAGAAAAALTIAGPGAALKPVSEGTWEVISLGAKRANWQLQAGGAVARPDPDLPGAFRVSELFQVVSPGAQLASSTPVVRVVTIWRQTALQGNKDAIGLQEELADMGEPDKARPYLIEAVQIAYILPEASVIDNEKNLASVTTRFRYSPILEPKVLAAGTTKPKFLAERTTMSPEMLALAI